MAEVPMTELEAVNLMLASIGEAPVDTLDAPGVVESAIAKTMLNSISRAVQAVGWWFNKDTDYPMTPDVNGEILIPANVMAIDTSAKSAHVDVVERGRKLWDRKNHTFVFSDTLYCDVTWMFPFSDLPQAARWYISMLAARKFHDSMVGSETLHSFTDEDQKMAYVMMVRADTEAEDSNMLNTHETLAISHRFINP